MGYSKVVIFGHPLHSHTHSYIHNAFYRAFKHLGYATYWFDNNTDVSNFDFSNSLFITEGQVDGKIPLRDDCTYILHNCYDEKYGSLFAKNRCIRLQVYTDDVLSRNLDKIEECIYYDIPSKCLYMPWATDLLPQEIDANKPATPFNYQSNRIAWVGSIGGERFGNINEIAPFKAACHENEIYFDHACNRSVEDNIALVKNSYMAPTLVGTWQHEVGYVPCRIFKNISYGQFGLTNSPRVYELFEHKIVHNNDTRQLFYDAKTRLESLLLSELHGLMDFVKEKHTYINRINTLLDFISKTTSL